MNIGGEGEDAASSLSATERYKLLPLTALPMRVKGEICDVMLHVAKIRLDYRLSKLLHGFHFLAQR